MLTYDQYNDLTQLLNTHFKAEIVAQGPLFTDTSGRCILWDRLYVPLGCVSSDHCEAYTYKIPIPYQIEEEIPVLNNNGEPEYDQWGIPKTEIVQRQRVETHTLTTFDYFQIPELGQCVGFLARDINKLIKHFGHLTIEDRRTRVPLGIPYQFTGKLFKRQRDALQTFMNPNISGILKCPPGWGKTVFMMAYIAIQEMRTLVVLHDTSLINQFMESARNPEFTNIAALEAQSDRQLMGRLEYNANTGEIVDYPITFLTYHLVNHHPQLMDKIQSRYGLVLIDECHHAAAASIDSILRKLTAFYMVGVTATVHRKDHFDVMFEDLIGPIRYIGTVNSDCHVIFKQGTQVSTRMSNLMRIKTRLSEDDVRNAKICAEINRRVKQGSVCGILLTHIPHGFALEKMFREKYPSLRVGFYAATAHRPKTLSDCKSRIDAPRRIKKLVMAESDCMRNATPLQWQTFDMSLNVDEIVQVLTDVGCPELLLSQCRIMAAESLQVFMSTRQIFAEGLDMPMLDHIEVVMPMAAPRKRQKKSGEQDTEGGVAQQIAGRTQRNIYLWDGTTINPNKPPSTMIYWVDSGPDILEGCRRSFRNACARVGYRITEEMDEHRMAFRKAMNRVAENA